MHAKINPKRLLSDLNELRRFGACGNGVVRRAFSREDIDSRRWLRQKMIDAGLDGQIDGVGNVLGFSRNRGKTLLMGSHTDTQPTGGWLDGSLGVIYALEVARALAESSSTKDLAVDVASWMDEESTFYGCLGSNSFCAKIDLERIADVKNRSGLRLCEAIQAAKLDGVAPAHMDPNRYAAYLEAHIEQGGRLESANKRIGIVTAIVGMRTFKIIFKGQQNHAGTTPMLQRKDAGMALIKFGTRVDAAYRRIAADQTVWTIGDVKFQPGAQSVIPGHAEMLLQFRDPDSGMLNQLEKAVRDLVATSNKEGMVKIKMETIGDDFPPAIMDKGLQEHIVRAAEIHAPGDWMHMPSGAGHDAMIFADMLPTAMMFIPSIGGISHSFAEDTKEEDIVLGCQVLATAAASILS